MATSEERVENVGRIERALSAAAGGALALLAIQRRSAAAVALAFAGGLLAYRGMTGFCPVYRALGIDTAAEDEHESRGRDLVDESSEESFPASDAPSWTPTTSVGHLHR